MHRFLLSFVFVALAAPAFASDGVLEINQACAVGPGCFPGDTAGFPVTISASGSYQLTGNLVVPDENTSGIYVTTQNVSIDLSGFEIRGPVECSGSPLICTPNAGVGSGVDFLNESSSSGMSVRNGSIQGMGKYGVRLALSSEVTGLRVRSNRATGIFVKDGSTVSGTTAYQNREYGIFASESSVVTGNTAYGNGADGIITGGASVVTGNTAYRNGANGILTGYGSSLSDNVAYSNGGGGIYTSGGCLVKGNTVRGNGLYGLNLGTDSAYSDNVVTNNTTGTVTGNGSSNIRGGNYCAGTGTGSAYCP